MKVKNKYIYNFIMWFFSCLVTLNMFGVFFGIYVYFEKGFLDTEIIFRMFILSMVSPFFVVFIEILFDVFIFLYRKILRNIKQNGV